MSNNPNFFLRGEVSLDLHGIPLGGNGKSTSPSRKQFGWEQEPNIFTGTWKLPMSRGFPRDFPPPVGKFPGTALKNENKKTTPPADPDLFFAPGMLPHASFPIICGTPPPPFPIFLRDHPFPIALVTPVFRLFFSCATPYIRYPDADLG